MEVDDKKGKVEKRASTAKGPNRPKSIFKSFFSPKDRRSLNVESDVPPVPDNDAVPKEEVKRKKKVASSRASRGSGIGFNFAKGLQESVSPKGRPSTALPSEVEFDREMVGDHEQNNLNCDHSIASEVRVSDTHSGESQRLSRSDDVTGSHITVGFIQLQDDSTNCSGSTVSESGDIVEPLNHRTLDDVHSPSETSRKSVSFQTHVVNTEINERNPADAYRRDSLYVDPSFYDDEDDDVSDDEDDQDDEDAVFDGVDGLRPQTSIRQVIPKSQRVATEIVTTEETYIGRLSVIKLLRERLEEENKKQGIISDEAMRNLFSNFDVIFDFHNNIILPQLQERMSKWNSSPRIGDIMKKFAPFLKMYTPYVKNIEGSRSLLTSLRQKSTKVAGIMSDIERMPSCCRLPLADFLSEPMSRLLRYKLLLSEYLRRLPEEAQDRQETEDALELISVAATHVNEAIRAEDNLAKIVQIQDSLRDPCELVTPTRRFIKEGRLAMADQKKGAQRLERHIFLFNNLLIVCQPPTMGLKYRLQKEIPLRGVKLEEDEQNKMFTIVSRQAVIELYGSTQQEAKQWVTTFHSVLSKYAEEEPEAFLETALPLTPEDELGYRAPRLVRKDTAKSCSQCGLGFVSIRRRKTYCMACGQVFCPRCSTRSIRLAYDQWRPGRVCDRCFSALRDDAVCRSIENLEEEECILNDQRL